MPESQKKAPALANLLNNALFDASHIEKQIQEEHEIREKFMGELKKAYEQGEDISEYVWPSEWDFRKRPRPHHASNIVSLADAIDLCGQHFYGAAWEERDWYARTPEEVECWSPEHDFYRARNFTSHKKGADFTGRPEEEKQSYARKAEIYSKLSSWLNQEAVEAFTLDEEGHKSCVSSNVWLSCDALKILDEGQIHEKDDGGKLKVSGKSDFVYLNKEQLEKYLRSLGSPKDMKKERKTLKPDGITCPEGIWVREATVLLNEKLFGEEAGQQRVGEGIRRLIEVLVTNPDIEVFTISSYGGRKEPIDPDYLRGRQPTKDFIRGFIPYSDGFHTNNEEGRFLFVNKEHFENYLTDKPIDEESVPDDSEQLNALSDTERKQLTEKIDQLQAELAAEKGKQVSPTERRLLTRERETVLKIIIGMAIKGYGHNPQASRNSTAGEVSSDLTLLGIPVSDDTILKYLKEAAEILPPDTE